MDPLLQRVQHSIQDYRMLPPGYTVLVAVSGGAQSGEYLSFSLPVEESPTTTQQQAARP